MSKDKKTNSSEECSSEIGYRRGYHHGYYQALCDVNGFHNLKTPELDSFLDQSICDWRFSYMRGGGVSMPPEFFKSSENKK